MRCNNSWTVCRQPTGTSQKRSVSDLAGAHRCETSESNPAAAAATAGTNWSAAEALFLFFRILRALLPGVGNFQNACRSFPLIWLAMRIQSAAYFLNFSDSCNLASSVPAEGNAGFWNFVLQQFCDVKLQGTIGPGATFTSACRGGLVAVFFRCRLPSICRGMREVSATSRRPRRQGTAPRHGGNVPRTRRQERYQAPGPA